MHWWAVICKWTHRKTKEFNLNYIYFHLLFLLLQLLNHKTQTHFQEWDFLNKIKRYNLGKKSLSILNWPKYKYHCSKNIPFLQLNCIGTKKNCLVLITEKNSERKGRAFKMCCVTSHSVKTGVCDNDWKFLLL